MAKSANGAGAKSSKKNRKWGRNRDSEANKRYKEAGRQVVNKIRKLMQHIKKYPKEGQGLATLQRLHMSSITHYNAAKKKLTGGFEL